MNKGIVYRVGAKDLYLSGSEYEKVYNKLIERSMFVQTKYRFYINILIEFNDDSTVLERPDGFIVRIVNVDYREERKTNIMKVRIGRIKWAISDSICTNSRRFIRKIRAIYNYPNDWMLQNIAWVQTDNKIVRRLNRILLTILLWTYWE